MQSSSESDPDPRVAGSSEILHAVEVLGRGGMVAFPTETYYGLAVDPFNRGAVSRLFAVKRRSPDKPILTLVANRAQLSTLVRTIPPEFEKLMDAFWPGPLTLVFEAAGDVPVTLAGYSGTVGVRVSSHPLAAQLVAAYGAPISATSANLSGLPAAVSAGEVSEQLGPDVDLILDGGMTPGGEGSTLVGMRDGCPILLRPGVISGEKINQALGGDILPVACEVE